MNKGGKTKGAAITIQSVDRIRKKFIRITYMKT